MGKLRLGYSSVIIFIFSMISACTSSNQISDQIDLLPIQLEEDGKWSFVDPEGKIVYEDEFKESPTCVVNGIFSVKEEDGYVLYKAKEKPAQIKGCEQLKAVGYLSDGLIPIVRDKSRIILVDAEGKEQFTLEPVKGKEVVSCSGGYSDGLLIIKEEGGEIGFVDTKGEVVIKPEYIEASNFSDGLAIVKKDDVYLIIDKKGTIILKLKKDWSPLGGVAYGVVVVKDANDRFLFVNEKGEADKCPAKVKGIFAYNENYYIFNDGESYGVMSRKDNEVIVRAKYNNIVFGSNDTFVCADDKGTYILNSKGDIDKSLDEYEGIYSLEKFGIFVKEKKTWLLLDSKGEPKKGCEFYGIMPFLFFGSEIKSDYFSLEGMVNSIVAKIDIKGFDNIKLGSSPQSLLSMPNKYTFSPNAELDSLSVTGYKYMYKATGHFSGVIASTSYDDYFLEPVSRWNDVKLIGVSVEVDAETSLGREAVQIFVSALEKKGFKLYTSNYKGDGGVVILTSKDSAVTIISDKGSSRLLLDIMVLPTEEQLRNLKRTFNNYWSETNYESGGVYTTEDNSSERIVDAIVDDSIDW